MLVFFLRRLAQAMVVMLSVAFIAFMLFQFVGDPVTNLLGQDATEEQRAALRRDLGLDRSFPIQFARFAVNAVQGEFGISLRQGRKVSTLIGERFPATLELAVVAGAIALGLGIPLGVYSRPCKTPATRMNTGFAGESRWRFPSISNPIGLDFWGASGWRRRIFSAAASTR